ncbi:FtsB family cell division protein [Pseudoclavibacter sp. 13-3]|uniref:FtsB family cell division protein n=1 Tax=Pseudoclavibacter sp. 13-3 TaxID=2901228 RepID=UPI001E4601BD|nr:septum formation initiator family protein [Pseudoclavibacter sp. 13-3]MCD7102246.1 septum formation initiator family protein [Pseudoclavibacter sp. 13-3]
MSEQRQGRRFPAFPVILTVALVAAALLLTPNIRLYVEQQQQKQQLQSEVDQQRSELGELQQERARWDDPAYIRAQTRQRLYFVVPGETTYVVVDGDQAKSADDRAHQTPSQSVTSSDQKWTDLLGSSIVQAGVGDQPLDGDQTQSDAGQPPSNDDDQGDQGGQNGQNDQGEQQEQQ